LHPSGISIFAGSVIGNSQGRTGLFAGAVAGGFIGVFVAVWLCSRLRLLEAKLEGKGSASLAPPIAGGSIGFVLAAVIAVNNLHTPFIPLACIGLIGAGVLLGKAIAGRRGSSPS
jgi:fructose-specific phosphotransferase system IIC component